MATTEQTSNLKPFEGDVQEASVAGEAETGSLLPSDIQPETTNAVQVIDWKEIEDLGNLGKEWKHSEVEAALNNLQLFGMSDWKFVHFGFNNAYRSRELTILLNNPFVAVAGYEATRITGFIACDDRWKAAIDSSLAEIQEAVENRKKQQEANAVAIAEFDEGVDSSYTEAAEGRNFETGTYPRFLPGVLDAKPQDYWVHARDAAKQTASQDARAQQSCFANVFAYFSARATLINYRSNTLYPYHVYGWMEQNRDRITELMESFGIEIDLDNLDASQDKLLKAIEIQKRRRLSQLSNKPLQRRAWHESESWVEEKYEAMKVDVNRVVYYVKKWSASPAVE